MRFVKLNLRAFGHFSNYELDFSSPRDGLQVVYGSNEAGKSTALRAVTGFLFGIPARTTDAFVHDHKQLQIAATLEHDGKRLDALRRKGNKNTLLDRDGQPTSEADLVTWLGGVEEKLFGLTFGLDHESLRAGGRMLLEGSGDLGETLYGAAFGGPAIRQLLARLEQQAEDIFKPSASKPKLNAAIAVFLDSKKHLDRGIVATQWKNQTTQLAQLDADSVVLNQRLRDLDQTVVQLGRVRSALEPLAKLANLRARRQVLANVVMLSPSAASERIAAVQLGNQAEQELAQSQAKAQSLRARLASLVIPTALLEHEVEISGLSQEIGNHDTEAKDLPRVQGELRTAEEEARRLLKELGQPDALERAATLIVEARTAARVSKLSKQLSGLEAPIAALDVEIERKGRQLVRLRQQEALLPPQQDVSALTQCLRRIEKQGDIEANLAAAATRLEAKEREAASQAGSLGLWTGTADALLALPVPTRQTCETAAGALESLQKRLQRLEGDLEDQDRRKRNDERDLRELEIGGNVPTEEDLQLSRSKREESWRTIRGHWLGELTGDASSLASQHEDYVIEADTVADRLRREADRVAKKARISADVEETTRQCQSLREDRLSLQAAAEIATNEWVAHWRASNIAPLPPREMLAWLGRLERAVQAVKDANTCQDEKRGIAGQVKALSGELRAVLPNAPESSLTVLLDQGEALRKRCEATETERDRFGRDIGRLVTETAESEATRNTKRVALETWHTEWAQVIASLPVSTDASVEEVEEVLGRINKLGTTMATVADKRHRVAGMERNAALRTNRLVDLTSRLAPELANLPWRDAAERLLAQLVKGRSDRYARISTESNLVEEEARLAEQSRRRAGAQAQLQSLMENAGVSDLQGLEAAEMLAAEAKGLDDEMTNLQERLIGLGNGLSLGAIQEEASRFDADRLPGQIAEARGEIATLEANRAELDQARGALRAELSKLDGSADNAAQSAAQLEQKIAAIHRLTEAYLRPHLARHLLTREINAYRERHQGPLLKRASEIFKGLTLNRYIRLNESFGENDKPVLGCIRAEGSGEREVEVAHLSDGTRDQLFLALRLASLEHQIHQRAALPVVLDDILIHFDDDRASAGVRALADLGSKMQVILFTHHSRIVELAKSVIPKEQLRVHELSPAAPSV